MSYFKTCPICGAHLDPGEVCDDCRNTREQTKGALPAGKQVEHLLNHSPKRTASKFYHGSLRPSRERSNI